ncbi:LysR family transcriptional regulator [Nocardia nova]|uniref:LysR family transcriptional regulator n=1 Tax=Nocardia nova TaxID=37330 RepID=A0A2S6AQ87_9NOCA|nr:LysR family transcriptional regulator [Nocardia nova]PPJ26588.1 LysR family transcriptional regulator [Nocardia nova]PPJ37388.1 LysR family transcriptional regulator [Nocardia nova]
MGIDFTRLKYFLAVADELHFKRAADRLHITPPPLSKQIKLLERELGGTLFERDYHAVRLTALGAALVAPARRILDLVAEFETTANSITHRVAPLRVGATAYAPSDLLYAFEDTVRQLSAPAEFSIPGSAAEVAAHLVAGHLDLGLIHLPCTDPRVEFRVISRYQSGIAVRTDDPLALRDAVTIEDLRDRQVAVDVASANPLAMSTLVRRLNARGVTQIVRAASGERGSEVELAAQVRSKRLVLLVAYAPDSSFGRVFSPPEFTLVPIDDNSWSQGQIALAWLRDRATSHPALKSATTELIALFNTE